ncbi:hypothetical protein B0O80DRAFT_499798 [Mortierella sp. GBAus27b]|nr:hypothetical protein BGX31_003280 [Mortierella sp. GBA43]KAI8351882.1 hypothetical protein B0O80DRAFT_499798 [Mortierella sp. GBAus27b]
MHLTYSVFLLFSAAVLAQAWSARTVSSRAIFTGEDNTIPGASLLDIFRDPRNHATAVASIIGSSARASHFKPKEHGLDENQDAYYDFVEDITSFPGFNVEYKDWFPLSLSLSGDVDQFKNQIATYYESPSGNKDVEVSALAYQITRTGPGAKNGTWLLSLTALHNDGDSNAVSVSLASVEVSVTITNQGDIIIWRQNTIFQQRILKVSSQILTAAAERLAEAIPKTDINAYEDRLTTLSANSRSHAWSWFLGSKQDCGAKSSPSTYWPRRQKLYRV